MFIDDIAVFKGEIYLLTADDELLLLVPGGDAEPQITTTTVSAAVKTVHRIPRDVQRWHDPYATDKYVVRRYLVASGEQLLMVKRELNVPPFLPWGSRIHMRTRRFEVFEAAELLSGGGGRWRQVDTLTGRAIFVSQGCSESLPGSDQCGGGGGIRQDCIYFVTDDEAHSFPEDPLFDSGVHDVRNRAVRPLPLPETVVAPGACDDPWSPTWLFPET
ncbi:uncharacterized protein LOC100846058 [Brachypodium distachyon]|nr:uncharacterized protein LOC100846058 [Brachypodium distachyon]|eukprot:XP_014756976.1 uncharacterized protein LOC100846058 [Brachypodium distachyon]